MGISTIQIWIIGELVAKLPDNLFPSHFRKLNVVFYQQIVEKKSFSRAITIVAEHLQWLWRNRVTLYVILP
jgi:hypothetical protein